MSQTLLLVITVISALFYYGAFALCFVKKQKNKLFANVLWVTAYALNLSLVVNNYLANGYVPFVSMYQVLTFLGICFAPIYLYFAYFEKGSWMRPYFTVAPAVIMTGLCFMDANAVWEFPPSLQSPWFVPHVLVYMISYTMGFIAFLICIIGIFSKKKQDKLRCERGVYDCISVVFPFMTFGMLFGAIWANEVWGHFWSWDNKESWSLVTWLTYMLYLHFRRHKSLQKFASVLAVLGFAGIIITFFFVNFMGSGNHAYS